MLEGEGHSLHTETQFLTSPAGRELGTLPKVLWEEWIKGHPCASESTGQVRLTGAPRRGGNRGDTAEGCARLGRSCWRAGPPGLPRFLPSPSSASVLDFVSSRHLRATPSRENQPASPRPYLYAPAGAGGVRRTLLSPGAPRAPASGSPRRRPRSASLRPTVLGRRS